jgi:ADP-L-glycero-D-manno-heptose 6-epimerase
MEILITGGAGFIGSQLAKYIKRIYPETRIVIYDIFDTMEKLGNGNLKYLGTYKNLIDLECEIICGDLKDIYNNLYDKKYNFDVIYHLAAVSDTRAENQNDILNNNLTPIKSIINLANIFNSRIVYASSAAVYGSLSKKKCIVGEESPENIYAFSKLSMDNYIKENPPDKGFVGLRYFNVFGPGEDNKDKTASVANQILKNIKDLKDINLFENSDKIFRDFVYIQDVVEATLKAGSANLSGVVNIGSGIAENFQTLADIILNETKHPVSINYIKNPYKDGYQFYTRACLEETKRIINWKPRFSLKMGIVDYLEKNQNG